MGEEARNQVDVKGQNQVEKSRAHFYPSKWEEEKPFQSRRSEEG